MYEPCLIVVASSGLEHRRELMTILANLGLDPICASAVEPCRELIMREKIDLVFCDRLFSDGDYLDVLAASSSAKSKPNVVLVCRHDVSEYREAIARGAFEMIGVPCRPTDVEWMVIQSKRSQRKRMQEEAAPPAVSSSEKVFRAGAA